MPSLLIQPLSISQTSFRTRRSYPNLNHVSLAPLTPRFPIDDLSNEHDGYFVDPDHHHQQQLLQWTRSSSYLSSSSVPGTPGVLSEFQSASRTRLQKKTRSSYTSESSLQRLASDRPRHQRGRSEIANITSTEVGARAGRTPLLSSRPAGRSGDSEWLLRAGLSLASSTREEKGQSWIVKRQSSTSLVSDADREDSLLVVPPAYRVDGSGSGGGGLRTSRSGRSTPGVQSRRSSRSRGGSRCASRHDLNMTSIVAAEGGAQSTAPDPQTGLTSPELSLPDFVDAEIRAEMEALQIRRHLEAEGKSQGASDAEDFSSSMDDDDYNDSDSGEGYDSDMDEAEFQRLTREQGFGLGSWIDYYIGWALFGIDEEYSLATTLPLDTAIASSSLSPHQGISLNHPATMTAEALREEEKAELKDNEDDHSDILDEPTVPIEKPGEQGGWADANWLLRLARRTLL